MAIGGSDDVILSALEGIGILFGVGGQDQHGVIFLRGAMASPEEGYSASAFMHAASSVAEVCASYAAFFYYAV